VTFEHGSEKGVQFDSDVCRSALSGPVDTGIHLETSGNNGTITVHVKNDPPRTTETTPALAVSADGSSTGAADFDEWGPEFGESATTSTLVCPIMVAPPDCPVPFPALLYVRRCKHADQYIYTGGWVIDDGSLYENSVTLLNVEGPTDVIGVGAGDLDGDGYGDVSYQPLKGLACRWTPALRVPTRKPHARSFLRAGFLRWLSAREVKSSLRASSHR
jgi:hypothetical protein